MNEKMDIPAPQYTIIEVLKICLAMARRGLEESRAIAIEFQRLATELREFVRVPGPEGKRGPKGDQGERGEQGKDGRPGRDGGYDKIEQIDEPEHYGHRYLRDGVVLEEHRWEKPKASISLLAEANKGVWREGSYGAGSIVTHRGHLWMAMCDTALQPDLSKDGTPWQMMIRKPRDGRDGEKGERGIQGPKGERGEPGPRSYGG